MFSKRFNIELPYALFLKCFGFFFLIRGSFWPTTLELSGTAYSALLFSSLNKKKIT